MTFIENWRFSIWFSFKALVGFVGSVDVLQEPVLDYWSILGGGCEFLTSWESTVAEGYKDNEDEALCVEDDKENSPLDDLDTNIPIICIYKDLKIADEEIEMN